MQLPLADQMGTHFGRGPELLLQNHSGLNSDLADWDLNLKREVGVLWSSAFSLLIWI